MADVLDLLGEHEAAIINYEEAIARSEPGEDAALAENKYGEFLRSEGQFDEAIIHHRRAQESKGAQNIYSSNRSDFDALCGMGRAYEEKGKAEEAENAFRAAIALRDPTDQAAADAHAEIGQILEGMSY